MLTLNPSLYTAGIRPSLRAMTDSIFGDVWHSHNNPNSLSTSSPSPSSVSSPATPLSPTTPIHPRSPYSHSRSSSYSSVQSSLGHQRPALIPDFPHMPPTMSPTLALARHSFHSPPQSPTHSPSSSISTIEAVNSWPSPRGIEYVRATVTLSPPPTSRPRLPPARPKSQPAQETERSKGLQPLFLECKARPSSHSRPPTPASAPLPLERTMSRDKRESVVEEPTSPNGLRPLLLSSKARPARSAEQRARDRMGLTEDKRGRSTWHAEPAAPDVPAKALSFRERARRTIASVADMDWQRFGAAQQKSRSPHHSVQRPLLAIGESDVESD